MICNVWKGSKIATIRKISWPKGEGGLSHGFQLTYMDAAKKRHRKTFPTKAAADAYRVKVEGELASHKHVPDNASRTVRKGWDEWLLYMENLQRTGKRERTTVRHYRTHFEKHISPLPIADMAMNQITSAHIQEFIETLEQKLSHALAVKIYITLRMLLGYCRRRRWLAHDPCEGIKLTRPKRYDVEPVTVPPKDEIRRLLDAAKADITGKSTAMLRLMVFRGLRISEVRGLPLKALELEGKAPQLKVMQRADDYCEIGRPKSHTSFRTLSLSPADVLALRTWMLSAKLTDCKDGEKLVFGTSTGKANSYQNLYYRWWLPLMKSAKLAVTVIDPKTKEPIMDKKTGKDKVVPAFTPHQLRHAFASLSIEHGIAPKKLQTMMGHSSIKMTMDVYGHLWKNDEADQAIAIAIERQISL